MKELAQGIRVLLAAKKVKERQTSYNCGKTGSMRGQNELLRRLGNRSTKTDTLVRYFDRKKKTNHDLAGRRYHRRVPP